MRTHETLSLVSVVAFLAGCATSSLKLAPAAPDVPWTPATAPDGAIVRAPHRQHQRRLTRTFYRPIQGCRSSERPAGTGSVALLYAA